MLSRSWQVISNLHSVVTSAVLDVRVRDACLCLLLVRSLKLLLTANESNITALRHRTISTTAENCDSTSSVLPVFSIPEVAFMKDVFGSGNEGVPSAFGSPVAHAGHWIIVVGQINVKIHMIEKLSARNFEKDVCLGSKTY